MGDFEEIVQSRLPPGVVVLDGEGNLCYGSPEALSLIPDLHSLLPDDSNPPTVLGGEILALVQRIKEKLGEGQTDPTVRVLQTDLETAYVLRGFPIGSPVSGTVTHFMILLEKLVRRRLGDVSRLSRKHGLTRREADIVKLVCAGLSNKEIAAKLFVSEHTVKDHVKNILEKVNVQSRAELTALVT